MNIKRERLRRSIAIATLVSNARSQTLRQENEVRRNLQEQLAMLDTKSIPEDIPWPGIEKGRFGYEQWAARRRSHLNLRLATQTFVCLDAADQMKLALNRQIAVEKIAARLLRG